MFFMEFVLYCIVVALHVAHSGYNFFVYYFLFSQDHIEILAGKSGDLLFFKGRENVWYPSLLVLHKCEYILFIILSMLV